MNDLQKAVLEILIDVDKVCRENDITYFLDSGTALGAVRHGGFIPWDDDIDIGMPRDDYEKFLKIAQEKLGDEYFVQTLDTEKKYYQIFAKIRKNGTKFVEPATRNVKMHQGIYIDVFPYDCIERERAVESLQELDQLRYRLHCMTLPDCMEVPSKSIKYIKKEIKTRIKFFVFKLYGRQKTIEKINNLIYENSNKKEDCVLVSYAYNIFPLIFEQNIFFPAKEIMFEEHSFFVQHDVDKYLTLIYGDYMQLPDEENRLTHSPLELEL